MIRVDEGWLMKNVNECWRRKSNGSTGKELWLRKTVNISIRGIVVKAKC